MRFTPLSHDERLAFERDGYLIVRNALDQQTVDAIIDVSDRLVASEQMYGRQRSENGKYDGFRNCIALDPAYLPLLTQETTLPRVLQLMSPNLQLHTSHLIYKAPDENSQARRSPGWHRDINTLPSDLGHHATSRVEIKVAFQLSNAPGHGCGQTIVAPGSHRLRTALALGEDGDPADFVEPLLAPGDAMLFENRTWHAGGYNLSSQTRKTLMFGYSYRWMRPDDYINQDEELLSRCDPIQLQLLGGTGGLFAPNGEFRSWGTERPLNDWCKEHGIGNAWKKELELAL